MHGLRVQSPMMVWELIHRLVEMLNRTFENVSELDIMINSGLVRGPNGSFATDMNLSRGVPSKERFMSDL